jgi:hypothetical protein
MGAPVHAPPTRPSTLTFEPQLPPTRPSTPTFGRIERIAEAPSRADPNISLVEMSSPAQAPPSPPRVSEPDRVNFNNPGDNMGQENEQNGNETAAVSFQVVFDTLYYIPNFGSPRCLLFSSALSFSEFASFTTHVSLSLFLRSRSAHCCWSHKELYIVSLQACTGALHTAGVFSTCSLFTLTCSFPPSRSRLGQAAALLTKRPIFCPFILFLEIWKDSANNFKDSNTTSPVANGDHAESNQDMILSSCSHRSYIPTPYNSPVARNPRSRSPNGIPSTRLRGGGPKRSAVSPINVAAKKPKILLNGRGNRKDRMYDDAEAVLADGNSPLYDDADISVSLK